MASRKALAALRVSSLEPCRIPSASSSLYSLPDCAASRAVSSAISRFCCCATPPSSDAFSCTFSFLWYTACRFQAPGFPGQLTQHQYVVGTLYLTHFGQTGCLTRSSPISDGSLAQPKQARLGASDAGKGARPSPAAGGAAAAVMAASLSAFSAASASRTSLVAAPRSGCCACSLASSGLKPRSGSASRSPRTASRRASDVQGSHMRGAPGQGQPGPAARCRRSRPVARPRQVFLREEGKRN
eukprot:scaffold62643_cov56-Phaeocystis_antarctica.AAC.3